MCGEDCCTNKYKNEDKTHCVSCKLSTHPSWDRECPEFQRRCRQFDENYLENNLTYFPKEESWMLTPHPQRLQHADKFLMTYAITPIQQPEQSACNLASRMQGRQESSKHTKPKPTSPPWTIITPGSTQPNPNLGMSRNLNNADTAAPTDLIPCTLNHQPFEPGFEPKPQGWN